MPLQPFTDLPCMEKFKIERATDISPETSGKLRYVVSQLIAS